MLTGRESLLRIIGKRRRFLPNRSSILAASSSSTFQSSLSLRETVEIPRIDSVEQGSHGDDDASGAVQCPVCGARFPGLDNALINSHLDGCLAEGSKRKLSHCVMVSDDFQAKRGKRKLNQVTLLQLNFSRSKVKFDPVQSANYSVISSEPDSIRNCDTNYNLNGLDRTEECTSAPFFPVTDDAFPSHVENLVSKDTSHCKFASPPSSPLGIESPKHVLAGHLDDCDLSKVIIPTFIVGRRFWFKEELHFESRICLTRDPGNVKDPNAIKVLYVGSDDKMLGYIPRELAQCLSPLMEKFGLNFEGSITSVPHDPQASVPVEILLENVVSFDQTCNVKCQEFKSLWKQALEVVELSKTKASRMTRYQQNLVLLIQEVLKSNSHLFTDTELSFLEALDLLPDDSKKLFARLYTRKGPWFRMSSISYPEIADCNRAIEGLLEAGYLCSFSQSTGLEEGDDLEEVLNILNVDELREALRVLKKKCNNGTLKQDMIELLLSSSKGCPCTELRGFVLATTGSCVKVSPLAEFLVWRAERLFFLNGEQDLSAFLLVDLGIMKYPAYRCMISEQIFQNRSELRSYEEALEVSQIIIESLDENNLKLVLQCIDISVSRMSSSLVEGKSSSGGSMATFISQFSASWVYSKVALLGVSFLEREKRYIDAINILKPLLNAFVSDRRRGYWNLRLSIDLEHLGRIDDSLQVAEDALLDPWVRAGSRVALQKRVLRLGKPPRRWKIPSYSKSVNRKISQVNVQGRPLNCKTGMKSVFYGEDGERCGVEELALQYYAGEGGGWQGTHAESGIWLTIFGILMWDVIFADVPNVFRTKFQTAPLDLDTDSFYESRKALIEPHLDKIQEGNAEEMLITTWESHIGTCCRGVNWEKHSLSNLRAVVKCIAPSSLASICRHLAQDYRSWSSGMPDLLLWRLHDCYRGEAKLVEVKGPRDRLSEQQRAWLLVLMDCGFCVEVCKVTPDPGSAI